MRNQKYIVMSFLSAGVLVGFSVRGLAIPLLARMEMGDPMILGLINATSLAGIITAVLTFVVLNRHPGVVRFTNEVVTELRRVTWPDREETLRSTTVVIGTTLFVALMLALYDYAWAEVTGYLLFSEG
ncbi:MAG: preprotein translocase subunit SecE [Myxococcota bacterium]